MSERNSTPAAARHRLSKKELRASLVLPIAIIVLIWLVGLVAFVVAPDNFTTVISLIIGAGLFGYLIVWTRHESPRQRIMALLLAIPALIGISLGLINGRSSFTIAGLGITVLLLIGQRLLTVPISYRFAYRAFRRGNDEAALAMLEKAIAARPDFWESYQLRAILLLAQQQHARAERDAQKAISLRPQSAQSHHILGQVYQDEGHFDKARACYQQALALVPATALYQYQLGLCHYRLQAYEAAAQSFAAATQGTLPQVEYDLLAHYYLGKALTALGNRDDIAATSFADMKKFAGGLPGLQRQVELLAGTETGKLLQTDLAEIKSLLQA